jgi:hypothetical protein
VRLQVWGRENGEDVLRQILNSEMELTVRDFDERFFQTASGINPNRLRMTEQGLEGRI